MISGEPLNGRDLTPVQRQVHRFIEDFAQRHGYPPSYREIGDAVGLASLSSVALHVQTLQKKGYLSHEPGRPRTAVARSYGSSADRKETDGAVPIELAPQTAVRVRLVGRIAAGEPILPGELSDDPLADDTYLLPTRLVGEGTLFMLRVAGDSMIGAGIADGDLVVIRQQPDAENGDIVAVLIDGIEVEGTVKTLQRSDGHVWLMPHNPVYTPIPGDDVTIVGKVVAVLRRV